MLTEAGEVKLLDFGLADASSDAETRIATAGRVVGTPAYMSPEQARGEPVDARADVFAFGVLLYELVAGERPFAQPTTLDGDDPAAWVPRRSLDDTIQPSHARELIARCLAFDASARPPDGAALVAALAAGESAVNPYRGLRAFEAGDRAVFFGRDAEARAVIERLRGDRLVVVAGDSGVGKSSLCRAAVVPRIEAGALEGRWTTVTLLPGHHAFAERVAALDADPPTTPTLLFVDQLEELVTTCTPAQREQIDRALVRLAQAPHIAVLATVRGDFVTRLAALPALGEQLGRALYILRPLGPAALREAIVAPATARGAAFESDGLVDELVGAARVAGGLPLLQFTLSELWDASDRVTLRASECSRRSAASAARSHATRTA